MNTAEQIQIFLEENKERQVLVLIWLRELYGYYDHNYSIITLAYRESPIKVPICRDTKKIVAEYSWTIIEFIDESIIYIVEKVESYKKSYHYITKKQKDLEDILS